MKRLSLTCSLLLAALAAHAQPADLLTRAERSGYAETSRYEDVAAFVETLAEQSPLVHLASYGYTTEGRLMPLVVVGRVEGASPDAVRASGKVRVLLQGNIHGGEVEGKEALLELLREIAAGQHAAWMDSLVLLVTPIYNADGNERVGLYNRPWQHGPFGGMGQRANAQGLDLNRDHMKLASPEARAFVSLLNAYYPHVTVDLHTTDGSFHGYHLTYAPGLNPNTDAATTAYLREQLLPEITRRVRQQDGFELYYYGNFDGFQQRPQRDPPGWYSFDHRPRFNNNYVGLRNRLAILSEAYAYLPFEERIRVTKRFVEEILDVAARDGAQIRSLVRAADAVEIAGRPFAVRSTYAPPDTIEVLVGDVVEERNPFTGALVYRRADVVTPTPMLDFSLFAGQEWTAAPAAYLIPASEAGLIELLTAHGAVVEEAQMGSVEVEQFRIDSVRVAERVFQNVREQTVFGGYRGQAVELEGEWAYVPVEGPLARIVVTLLEPRSDDGAVAWGVFGDRLKTGETYPVWRIPAAPGN